MRYYPVFLDLANQTAVVVGDDDLAREKAALLIEAGARVRQITGRDYRRGDLAGVRIVIDASGDPEVNRRTWADAEAAGILINVLDRPEKCRFIAPAIVRRDPVVIAISTSGESPFLAAQLRQRIERLIGAEWGPFTASLGRIRRRLRAQRVGIAEQSRIYRRLLQSSVRSLIAAGRSRDADAQAAAIQTSPRNCGRVAIVGAGPGDPGLLTLRARELLFDADYVLYDALVAPETLALCGPGARLEPVGKRAGASESAAQEWINSRLIELARGDNYVVRLKGGDPFVFGRGGEELIALAKAEIDALIVPGVTSALAAPAALGISATLRGVSSSIAITSAQSNEPSDRLSQIARASDTLIVLMARNNLAATTRSLAAAIGSDRPAAIVSDATLENERHAVGTLADIAMLADREGIGTPATLIVGDVIAALPVRELATLASSQLQIAR